MFVIIDEQNDMVMGAFTEPNTIMENEVMGAFTDMLNSSMNSS